MTKHLGDFDASAVVYGKFTTFRPSTGAAFTLGGTPALSVYKDNSTTQSTTGVTLTADFDSVTGLNHFAIDTSADGTFYAAGSFFDIVITTGTVDSVSVVGAVVGNFTIRKNSALKPTTAGRTLVVDASGLADANVVKVGPTGSGTAQTAGDIPARLPAALTANGNMKSSMVEILTTALTETAGLLAGGFKKFFNIATPAATMDHLVLVDTVTTATTATNLTTNNDKTGYGLSAAAVQAIWDALTAALTTANSIGKLLSNFVFTVANRVDSQVLGVQSAAANLKKNTAFSAFEFVMTDSTNHNPATGLTVTSTRSIDGAAFGACANSAAEVASGVYKIDLAAADLNGNAITLRFTAAAADDRLITIVTQP